MHPSPDDWNDFYAKMKAKTGLDLHLYKVNQMQRRIASMVTNQGCKSLAEFWSWVSASPANIEHFMDRLAINVSELFRNPEKWREMEEHVLPMLLKSSSRLKVWSAGCSYGAEAHTLAMILRQKFPSNHQIIGTDIDMAALNQAKLGVFSNDDTRYVPAEYKKFLEQTESGWVADKGLRSMLSFHKQNLLLDRFESGFDLIMCRNVVIYFTDEAKEQLYKRFAAALKPGGVLFVGSTERVSSADSIGLTTIRPFYYQKQREEKQWRNAS